MKPPGFVGKNFPDHICRLKKALYGLKQVPHAWYTELWVLLLSLGFVNSTVDASLCIHHNPGVKLCLLVYFDDIIVTGSSPVEVSTLATRFSLKDLGCLNYSLGVKVTPSTVGIFLSQRKYITDLLHKSGMADTKPTSTPFSATYKLLKDYGDLLPSPTKYRALVGSLQYLSLNRPYMSLSTNKLAQFMQNPIMAHWTALKKVLRYLAGSCDKGVFISTTAPLYLHHGYLFYLSSTPISWSSRKQRFVTRYSTEA